MIQNPLNSKIKFKIKEGSQILQYMLLNILIIHLLDTFNGIFKCFLLHHSPFSIKFIQARNYVLLF